MKSIKIIFAGDLMPGGVVVDKNDVFSDEIKNIFLEADIRIATLECAIGENMSFDPVKMENPLWRNIIYAPNRAIEKLKILKINLVSLANNHIFDLSEEGLFNTITLLRKNGIQYVGAGYNKDDASKPAVFDVNGKKIAILAYMESYWRAPHPADDNSPGINLLYMDKVVEDIRLAKAKYDYVFVMPHWGIEYTYFPTANDRKKAIQMVKAGADGIIGSHTHQIQPWMKIKKSIVFFSLGNFLFPDFYMLPDRPICYPEDANIKDYPISYTYPKNAKSIIRRVWKKKNRKGILAEILISNKVDSKVTFIELDEENNVVLIKHKRYLKLILLAISRLLRFDFYWIIVKGKNFMSRIMQKIVKLN